MCELMTSTLTSIRSEVARTGQPSPAIGRADYALVLLSAGGCHSSASRSSVRIQDMTPVLPYPHVLASPLSLANPSSPLCSTHLPTKNSSIPAPVIPRGDAVPSHPSAPHTYLMPLAGPEGFAMGGGAELATAADFRVMSELGGRMQFVQVKMGVSTGTATTSHAHHDQAPC